MPPSIKLQVKPKQSLGQNFLIDDNIARKIVRALDLKEHDVVVEIGPGQGALTKYLAGKARHLIAVEIDGRMVEDLQRKSSFPSDVILHSDFLECPLGDWQKQYKTKLRLVGNIPYHLTSPILFKVFEERSTVQDLTLMVQRELARRIVAKPRTKEYGILSVFSQFYGAPSILFNVPPSCFYPKPKVTSTVMQIRFQQHPVHRIDEDLFSTVVRTTFGKRRKTLRSSLKYLPYDKADMERVLQRLDFPLHRRPEDLSVDEFLLLTQSIGQTLS